MAVLYHILPCLQVLTFREEKCYSVSMKEELHLKLIVRLFTDDHQRCFGPGIATLLHRVEERHSLRAAAASMDMAYSKAWRIIRTAEEVFGCKLLQSTIGGQHGGGAILTEEAKRLLTAYDTYCADVSRYCEERFEAAFGFYRELDKQ